MYYNAETGVEISDDDMAGTECSCPRYSGPSRFGAYMQSVRDRRPDAVVWCACIGWRDGRGDDTAAVPTVSPYDPAITAMSPMHYPSSFHRPVTR
jgi:hypothetical protein